MKNFKKLVVLSLAIVTFVSSLAFSASATGRILLKVPHSGFSLPITTLSGKYPQGGEKQLISSWAGSMARSLRHEFLFVANTMRTHSIGERVAVKRYDANDFLDGIAIMKHEGVDGSIIGNSINPIRFQHLVAGTYQTWAIAYGKKYFSVASGGGTGRTLHLDNMVAGSASYGLTDSLGRTHSDAQFANVRSTLAMGIRPEDLCYTVVSLAPEVL